MRDYRPGTVLTGNARQTARDKAAHLYGQGCTIKSVAAQLGRSYGGTRVLLLEAGVTLRGRGGNVRKAAI